MEKHEILEEEALFDIEHGKYNKAASALYFALRYLAEKILRLLDEQIPRRDDKLANAISNKGLANASLALRILYKLRIKADYDKTSVCEEEIIEIQQHYRKAKKEMIEYLNKIRKSG